MTANTERITAALADRYRVLRRLGEGGMATVYLAEDLKHERQVALKVLRPELAAVLGAERFVQEIKTTANLQHPHILPLFDSGTAGQRDGGTEFLYYVMPFIDGETLRDKLDRETQLGVDEAVRVTTEIADALDYAHRHGVIHRDIKPENILLHDGRPMVADFGIALAVSAAAGGRMTETGLSLGTPHYMSPEQATAEKDLSARADIYSLGSVLYEMLTGDPPHTGSSAQQIIMKIVTDEARPVTELRKSVPPNVAAAVAKSLEKLPADRFDSAAAFGEALASADFTNPRMVAAPASDAHEVIGRDPVKTGLAVLSTVLALLLIRTWFFEPQPPADVIRIDTRPMAQSEIFRQYGTSITLSPDGRSMIRSGTGESTNGVLWLRRWDSLGEQPLRGVDGAYGPVYSPDGLEVAFLSGIGDLTVYSITTGTQRTLLDSGLTDVSVRSGGLDWEADGFIYASGLRGLIRVDPSDGEVTQVTTFDPARGEVAHGWVDALPNGKGALVTIVPPSVADLPSYVVGVANFRSGEVREIYQATAARYVHTGHVVFVRPDGSMVVAPFDQEAMELTGEAIALPDTVEVGTLGSPELTISESGTMAYVRARDQSGELTWVDRDGTEDADPAPDAEELLNPSISPDGSKIAVSVLMSDGWQVWVRPILSGAPVRITYSGANNSRAIWHPSGNLLAMVADPEGSSRAYLAPADASAPPRPVATDEDREVFGVEWSPNGGWLLLRTDNQASGLGDILAVRPGVDSTARVLVASPAEEISPSISPDGSLLAYVSSISGRREIYVRPFLADPDEDGLRVSNGGGTEPLWAHSGRELFYRSGTDSLVSVEILPGPRPGSSTTLFSTRVYEPHEFHRNYDISRDDRSFLMVKRSDVEDQIVVVINWDEELRKMFRN